MIRNHRIPLFIALILASCDASRSDDLDMTRVAQGVHGTYGDVSFSSLQYGDTFEITVELNGLTLVALNDPKGGAIQFDGFATDSGGNTQLLEEDRRLIAGLRAALDELGMNVSAPIQQLRAFVGLWEEWPESMNLQREVLAAPDRSASLCSSMNSYVVATHDCDFRPRDHDDSTLNGGAYISMHAAGPCDDGTYFWAPYSGNYYVYPGILSYWSQVEYKSQGWNCFEPDHDYDIEYAYGNCFGRCGDGCGSGTVFTKDCLDHDECVRFGHAAGSGWCSDELAGAAWDAANGSNCL